MIRLDDRSAAAWLREADPGGWTGYDVRGWPRSVWILHAMYERDDIPGGLTHDDVHRITQAVEPTPRPPDIDAELYETLEASTVVGAPLGRSRAPGPPWRRLRWAELARRLGTDLFADGRPPTHRSFGHSSWPANIRPSAAGALDREQYARLLELLAEHEPDGGETECFALYAGCWTWDDEHLFVGTLREAIDQYDRHESRGAPNNVWPADRSWLTFSDYDLHGTRVGGSEQLVERLQADPELETVVLG